MIRRLARTGLKRLNQMSWIRNQFGWKFFLGLQRLVRDFDVNQYPVDVDPLEVHWIDPDRIQHMTGRDWKPWSERVLNIGRVMDGRWDQTIPDGIEPDYYKPWSRKFEDHGIVQTLRQRIEDGDPWRSTPRYNRLRPMYESHEKLCKRLDRFEDLYYNILDNGYMTQRELWVKQPGKKRPIQHLADEITIDISRNGDPLFVDGRHRLAIAKYLDLDEIPVVVLVRHEDCLEDGDGI